MAAQIPAAKRLRGLGLGWRQVAAAVKERIAPDDLDRIWLFAPVRQEGREWGTAVVLERLDGQRRRVYTASYVMALRGRDRGSIKVTLDEIGESPSVVAEDVIAGVQERAGESEPPEEVTPAQWYTDEAESEIEPPDDVSAVESHRMEATEP